MTGTARPPSYSPHGIEVLIITVINAVILGNGGEFSQGGRRWYHAVHRTPELPEAPVGGRERTCLGCFCRAPDVRLDAIDAKVMEEYLRSCTHPEALRAGFPFYRHLSREAADNEALLVSVLRLSIPVVAIDGRRAGGLDASMRRVTTDVRGLTVGGSGHFVPAEHPEVTARAILQHVEWCA